MAGRPVMLQWWSSKGEADLKVLDELEEAVRLPAGPFELSEEIAFGGSVIKVHRERDKAKKERRPVHWYCASTCPIVERKQSGVARTQVQERCTAPVWLAALSFVRRFSPPARLRPYQPISQRCVGCVGSLC